MIQFAIPTHPYLVPEVPGTIRLQYKSTHHLTPPTFPCRLQQPTHPLPAFQRSSLPRLTATNLVRHIVTSLTSSQTHRHTHTHLSLSRFLSHPKCCSSLPSLLRSPASLSSLSPLPLTPTSVSGDLALVDQTTLKAASWSVPVSLTGIPLHPSPTPMVS